MSDFLLLMLLVALLGFWWDSLGVRQVARLAGRRICEREGLQFLDDTVTINRVRLRRDGRGRLMIYRQYRFEYSMSGEERLRGQIELLGKQVMHVELGWQEF